MSSRLKRIINRLPSKDGDAPVFLGEPAGIDDRRVNIFGIERRVVLDDFFRAEPLRQGV
jgi:hypothetical protein